VINQIARDNSNSIESITSDEEEENGSANLDGDQSVPISVTSTVSPPKSHTMSKPSSIPTNHLTSLALTSVT